MISIKNYPANKEYYIRLMKFGREVLDICKSLGITPVVWGGLAFFGHTKDGKIDVKDIDFLVPGDSIDKIMKVLDKKGIKYNYIPDWRSLQVFNEDLIIEFDPAERYAGGKDFEDFDFNGLVVKAVSLKNLIQIYKNASEASKDKPEQHRKRLEQLKKLVS